jgi:hypothetical protein
MEQLTQPSGLSHAVDNGAILGLIARAGDDTILGLSAREGDDSLPLGRPGHQIVPQEHHIA